MSLRLKTTLVILISCLICASIPFFYSIHESEKLLRAGIIKKSQTVLSRLESIRTYIASQGGLDLTIKNIVEKHKSPQDVTEAEKLAILKQVPIFAAMKVGSDNIEKENYKFRVFSDAPRRKENQATPHETKILERFLADPGLDEIIEDDDKQITVYRPVRLSESQGCLLCHGNPSRSPWGNGQDILGYRMEDWSDGKLHGAFAIVTDVELVARAEADPAGDRLFLLLLLAGISIAVLFGFLFMTSIARRISALADVLSERSRAVLGESDTLSAASSQLSASMHQQSAAIQETVASIDQINAIAAQNSDNAVSSEREAQGMNRLADDGQGSVRAVNSSIDEISANNEQIAARVHESNQKLERIVSLISEISSKTRVINDIVFQTRLLSFNASVEAARAGENGKGFAVVAEEVGNLAQMSGNASTEISKLLSESTEEVKKIVEETKSSVTTLIEGAAHKLEDGKRKSHSCSDIFEQIMSQVQKVSSSIAGIATSGKEQAQGIRQITDAMNSLSQSTEETTTATQSTSNAAHTLKTEAEQLEFLVADLTGMIHGRRPERVAEQPKAS